MVTAGELLSGFARGRHELANRRILNEFIASPRVRVAALSLDTGEFYSRILNDMRRLGKMIPTNDIWIAACAMESGAKVATADKHFLKIPGLLCEFIVT